jgi:hypothetical protein
MPILLNLFLFSPEGSSEIFEFSFYHTKAPMYRGNFGNPGGFTFFPKKAKVKYDFRLFSAKHTGPQGP